MLPYPKTILFAFALICFMQVKVGQPDGDSLKTAAKNLRQDITTIANRLRRERIITVHERDSVLLLIRPGNGDSKTLTIDELMMLRDNLEHKYSEEQEAIVEEFFQPGEREKNGMLPSTLSIPKGDHRSEEAHDNPMMRGHGRSPNDDETVRYNSIERNYSTPDTLSAKKRRFFRWLSIFTGGRVSPDNPYGGVYNPTQLHIPEPPGRPMGLDERMFEDTTRFDPNVYRRSTPAPFRVREADRKAFSERQKRKKGE